MKTEKRERCRTLRQQGKSLKEIAKEVSVALSSVSRWVKDIVLDPLQIESLGQRVSLNRGLTRETSKARAAERRAAYSAQGYHRATTDSNFRVICALYWGEGRKGRSSVSLVNSDPGMIRLFANWLRSNGWQFSVDVQFHTDNGLHPEEIKDWWLKQAGVDVRFYPISRSNRRLVGKLPYGTATIGVHRVELLYQIYGGIEYLKTGG